MPPDLFEKLIKSFSLSNKTKIYGRKKELKAINNFINNKAIILHVVGKPGTGKTSCVLNELKDTFLYTNYFTDINISKLIRNSKKKIIVIDEFDRFFEEKRRECISLMLSIRRKKQKLITISNNLILNCKNYNEKSNINLLQFLPYKRDDFIEIIKSKIEMINNDDENNINDENNENNINDENNININTTINNNNINKIQIY
ncbi:orc1 [Nucleospora cyclopteri]